jgi:DMSO/TMAO reductase YedYZ heme-binding membrane subunit
MSGNLKDRPFLLLMLRVMRVMLGICAATLVVVGGAIFYSVTKVQGRERQRADWCRDDIGLGIIAFLLLVSLVMTVLATRILRQNA